MKKIIKDDIVYNIDGNVVHFITDEDSRPNWSKILNQHLILNNTNLQMKQRYNSQRTIMNKDDAHKQFVKFVSEVRGVKVDLASGPSGYFSPFLDTLDNSDIFIATDACPMVIEAHSKACNKDNFYVFDMDLDKSLPFKDESVDIFTGNLLMNVENYSALIQEAYRCLKKGGKLAVIEIFFEQGSKTYEHLCSKGAIWSSFETFVDYCEKFGFVFIGSDIINTRKGKISEGDLYPLDYNDCSCDRTVYFKKV